jgi:heptosyltransferase-2
MQIIIKTPNFIGDTIMMLPALLLLQEHYKKAEFTIVCPAHSKDLFRGYHIKEIIIDDTKGKNRIQKTLYLVKKIRTNHYDLGILFHNALSSALLFKLAKIDKIIGYKNGGREIFLDFTLKINRARHYVNHYAHLVNSYIGNIYEILPPSKLHIQKQKLFSKSTQRTIALVLGTDKGDRGYPKEHSQKLCQLLNKLDYQIILLGDAHDKPSNTSYAHLMPQAIDLTAKTTIAEFIDIIADIDLLVSIDTSAIHIAAATNTKFITLLGQGTSPFSIVQPKVDFGSYLYAGETFIKDSAQIKAITPEMIITEIKERLS